MGQSASSQREREAFLHRDSRRFSQLVQDRGSRSTLQTRVRATGQGQMDQPSSLPSAGLAQQQDAQSTRPFATFSRQISAQSIPVRGNLSNSGDTLTRDQIFYEQQEERPLVHMEDLGMRDAPITHITASPMPRRSSVISRLSSRLLPRYSSVGSSNTDQEGYGEGRTLRRRLSDRLPSGATEDSGPRNNHRFSMLGSLSPGSSTSLRTRRRRELAPISRPFPLVLDGSLPSTGYTVTSTQGPALEEIAEPRRILPSSLTPSSVRSSRMSRVRRSLSIPIENLLSTSREQVTRDQGNQTSPRRPTTVIVADNTDYLLPPLAATDTSIDLNGPAIDSLLPNNRDQRTQAVPAVVESPERPAARSEGSSWAERWADRGSGGRREPRRMPNMLRGRSSRLIRRDDEGPLPRILHLAAAAIAAQLSGTPEQAITNMQAVGADGLDGSLNTLFRTLQQATASTGDVRTLEGGNDPTRPAGTLPPLNFLRVFRFVNTTPGSGGASSAASATERLASRARADERPSTTDDHLDGSDGRTVTLVVVGVRSVPSDHVVHEDAANADPSLDALLSLPVAPSNNLLRGGGGGLLRHADGRSRFAHRRRASMGGVNTFPANYDSQRHQRMLNSSRQGSAEATPISHSGVPNAMSESPPGPHPPPSTPADPGLSAFSSGTTTPNRRPSSASAAQHPPLPTRDIATQHLREAGILTPEDQATRSVQQRRRSDSEFARHRDLGAGAARRNGVVEPDDVEPDETPSQGSRSWLIYVVGTNLSEDHPAFAAPSLFTDVSAPTFDCTLESQCANSCWPPEPHVRGYDVTVSTSGTCEAACCQSRGRCIGSRHLPCPEIYRYAPCVCYPGYRPHPDSSWRAVSGLSLRLRA